MKNKFINIVIIFVFSTFLGVLNVNASTYTPTTNLFENSYSNNLIDMAISQIDNFINKKYAIFQVDYNYYLVCSENYSINGNTITFTDSTIISAIRSNSSYSSYEYNSYTEGSTSIYSSYVIISNTEFSRSISSKRFQDYYSNKYNVTLLMFILGIVFAIFVTKERRFL